MVDGGGSASRGGAASRRELVEKIDRFPAAPGVYLLKDRRNRILYIGKAVNLRARVRSYFTHASDTRVFHQFLIQKVADADCIVAASETEALLLENNLIKKHRPVYNIRLRDDKSYICLKVTVTERWPRVLTTRRYQDDGDLYFGPYGSASAVREMLRVIKKVFPLRTCTNGFFARRTRPCIEHDIGRCTAPCVGLIGEEKYREDVEEVILFLKGKNDVLLELLDRKMKTAARDRRFELAARYRDQMRAIEKVFEVQKAQGLGRGDRDVFAHVRQGDAVGIQEIVIRDGKIINSHCHTFRSSLETPEILSSFLSQCYLSERYVPPEIICEVDFADRSILEGWLREKRGAAVKLIVPRRGEKLRFVKMALENARNAFAVLRSRGERLQAALGELGRLLGLPRPPRRIECYDISNFQGSLAVGAMVAFEDGRPDREQYRKFRIRTVEGADDFRMMREVLERRLAHLPDEGEEPPDLLVIDGGKGQLAIALEVLASCGLDGRIGAIALAKERRRKGTTERIFVPGRSDPLPLSQDSPESLLVQEIRDEAHRFAIRYHRELRRKSTLRTGLEGIPGIGRERRDKLIERFSTLKGIRAASEESIAEVVGSRLAAEVFRRLH